MQLAARMIGGIGLALLAGSLASAQSPEVPPDLPQQLSEFSLEQLVDLEIDSVYGASAYAQKTVEAPSSVTIITAEQIRKRADRSLSDVLRGVRGFYVTNDRNYSFLGMRGFSRPGDYNARVLLLIDGHRLNDNIFGSALLGTEFPLDIELIDRVEIIRGPSSSLYGASAFFAVINIITKRPASAKGLDASSAVGTFDTYQLRASYGHKFVRGAEMLVSASSYTSQGQRHLYFREFDSPNTNNGFADRADSDDFSHLFGKVSFGNFTVQGLYGSRDKRVPTASFGTIFNDSRSGTVETQGYLDLQYGRRVASGWHLASRVYLDRYLYDGDYVFDQSTDATPLPVMNRDFARGDRWGSELKLTKRFTNRRALAVGGELRHNFRQNQVNLDVDPYMPYFDDRRSSANWAAYVQGELPVHARVLLNLGLRHDQYDTFGGTTNPRLAAIYTATNTTTLKLLYGQAFRAPNAYELFWQYPGLARANPTLQPETNRTSEVVLEQTFGGGLRLTATGFYYRVRGLITQQTDPADELLVYNNIGTIYAKGLELDVERKWRSGLEVRASYALQNSRDQETQAALTNSPRHVTQFGLMTPLMKPRLFATVEMRHMSERRTIAGNVVSSVFVPNVSLVAPDLPMGLELSASIFNVFNNQYSDPGSEEHRQDAIVQPGRTLRVKLTYRFPRSW